MFVASLKERPGHWAVAETWENAARRSASSSLVARLKKAGCEATSRSVDGTIIVYARWPEQDAAEPKPTPLRPGRAVSKAVGYPCDDCDYEADTPGGLKVHRRRQHAA